MNERLLPRPVLVAAIRELIDDVRHRRAAVPADAVEREFYLGIEGAAEEVLHPELTMTRDERWLDRQCLPFRDGYQRTRILLATVASTGEVPLRFPVFEAPSEVARH